MRRAAFPHIAPHSLTAVSQTARPSRGEYIASDSSRENAVECKGVWSLTITVVDYRVLNGNVATAVGIPAIRVLGHVLALAESTNVDVVEDDVGRVGDEMVVLRTVSHDNVGDDAVVEAVDTEQYRPKSVDVLGIEVVPDLPVAVEGAAYFLVSFCSFRGARYGK